MSKYFCPVRAFFNLGRAKNRRGVSQVNNVDGVLWCVVECVLRIGCSVLCGVVWSVC